MNYLPYFHSPTDPKWRLIIRHSKWMCVMLIASMIMFISCGGRQPPATVLYTIGGTVRGMVGSGLILQNNGGDNLSISANGSFTFSTSVSNGAGYNVTVFSQPISPSQTCTVSNGSGTVAGINVNNINIECTIIGGSSGYLDTTFGTGGKGCIKHIRRIIFKQCCHPVRWKHCCSWEFKEWLFL
jgi:hypothetical protein